MPGLWAFSDSAKVPIFCPSAEQKYGSQPLCFLQDAVMVLISVSIMNWWRESNTTFCNSGIISWGGNSAEILKGSHLLTWNRFENSVRIYESNFSCGFCCDHRLSLLVFQYLDENL